MVYCIGLTGNIASGKSTVATLFANFGACVISADAISKQLTAKNQSATHQIIAHFGKRIEFHPGEINRKQLRTLIFSDPVAKKWLEDLLHPLIRQGIEEELAKTKSPYCIIEIPLLIDKALYPYLNKILLVTAPLASQIERVMKRDHCTKEEALVILGNQASLEKYSEGADDLLHNDLGLDELKQKVEVLHRAYLQEALQLTKTLLNPPK